VAEARLIDPTNGATLLCSDEHQGFIFKSTNGGNSWITAFKQPDSNGGNRHGAKELIVAPSDSRTIYAAIARTGCFRAAEPGFPDSYGFYRSTNAARPGRRITPDYRRRIST